MVLKLYGFPQSTATGLAALVLHEKKDDDGFILYEARAIARYIIAKYPTQGTQGLIPTELKANALFEQAASTEFANFHSHASAASFEGWVKKNLGLEPDQAAFERHIAALEARLDVYEQILGRQKYLAGNELTLADLFHLPFAARLPLTGAKSIENRVNVSKWLNELASRPAWVAVKDGVTSTA
ncbi:glutathione S-transferase [Cyathus striatus]|nr:glutathione S-transferase [Cyathus striatus]